VLAHQQAERGALDVLLDEIGHRHQALADHLQLDGVELRGRRRAHEPAPRGARAIRSRSSPSSPTVTDSPGAMTVVELYSSMIAGPSIRVPGTRSVRRWIGVASLPPAPAKCTSRVTGSGRAGPGRPPDASPRAASA